MSPVALAILPFAAMGVFALIVVWAIRASIPAPRPIKSSESHDPAAPGGR